MDIFRRRDDDDDGGSNDSLIVALGARDLIARARYIGGRESRSTRAWRVLEATCVCVYTIRINKMQHFEIIQLFNILYYFMRIYEK